MMRVAARRRALEYLARHRAGESYDDIAASDGISRSRAYAIVTKGKRIERGARGIKPGAVVPVK